MKTASLLLALFAAATLAAPTRLLNAINRGIDHEDEVVTWADVVDRDIIQEDEVVTWADVVDRDIIQEDEVVN
jgi:hypothetical protein